MAFDIEETGVINDYDTLVAMFLTMGIDIDRTKVRDVYKKLFGGNSSSSTNNEV